jgi:hypothetical protein
MDPAPWLARLRHDLIKRLLWPARDRRDLGGAPEPGELVPRLIDDEGRPITAGALWAALAAEAPPGLELARFGRALAAAAAAAAAGDVGGVLALEPELEALELKVKGLEGKGLEVKGLARGLKARDGGDTGR